MNIITVNQKNLCGCLLLIALLLAATRTAPAQSVSSNDKERGQMMLSVAKSDIKDKYYDLTFHGVDVDAAFKEASEKIKSAQSNGQILGIIAQTVLSLNDSHTFLIPPGRRVSTDYGFEMIVIGDDVYVSKVNEKSDAEAKGLKVGDRVHRVDRYQPARENLWTLVYLYYALRPQPGMQVTVSSSASEPRTLDIIAKTTERNRTDLTSYNDYMRLVVEGQAEERRRKKSHRLQELDGLLIWKMPAFDMSVDEVDSFMDKARNCKTLVLDLRGNGGGFEDALLRMIGNLFDRDLKVGEIHRRKEIKPFTAKTRGDKAFKGELIVLVDSLSASSSEVLARVVQSEKRGIVIGDRTSGAVMRSIVHNHEVGVTSATFFAVSVTDADLKMSDGKSLERVGVTPDELKLPTGADLAAKTDPVLAYAVSRAGVKMDPVKAGSLFPAIKEKP